jgi:hypothetical protein
VKRSGFINRKTPLRARRHEPTVQREDKPRAFVMPTVKSLHTATYSGGTSGRPIPKENPVRSERYLRLVAALPCKACGRLGRSQAAHLPPDGKQIKQDDRLTFPLCADQPGALGCHSKYDRYILFPREQAMEQGKRWAADTRAQIRMAGAWPKNLPEWSDT